MVPDADTHVIDLFQLRDSGFGERARHGYVSAIVTSVGRHNVSFDGNDMGFVEIDSLVQSKVQSFALDEMAQQSRALRRIHFCHGTQLHGNSLNGNFATYFYFLVYDETHLNLKLILGILKYLNVRIGK